MLRGVAGEEVWGDAGRAGRRGEHCVELQLGLLACIAARCSLRMCSSICLLRLHALAGRVVAAAGYGTAVVVLGLQLGRPARQLGEGEGGQLGLLPPATPSSAFLKPAGGPGLGRHHRRALLHRGAQAAALH